MAEIQAPADVRIPPRVGVGAAHNDPNAPTVTMYWQGVACTVAEGDVAKLQAAGWLLHTPEDLVDLAKEVGALSDELNKAVAAFVSGVVADGVIDPAENHAHYAMASASNRLNQRLSDIVTVAAANYPVAESREPAKAKAERIAADIAYHGWTPDEAQKRYGLTDDEIAAARAVAVATP